MRRFGIFWLIVLSAGCVAQPTAQQWEQNALAFLVDGSTTREQILLKLGEPTGRFESDRILTYRIARKDPDEVRVIPRSTDVGAPNYSGIDYSLVLVFSGNVLHTHSLVPVR